MRPMYLNTSHPKYDRKMELLCLLSMEPSSRESLRHDLRVTGEELKTLAKECEAYGVHGVRADINGEPRNCLAIRSEHWDAVKSVAEEYMERVYSAESTIAAA